MATETQIIEQLLNANVRMTEQLVSLAQSVIASAQDRVPAFVGNAEVPERRTAPSFDLSTVDDWNDIGDARTGSPFGTSRTLHVSEDEEDASFARSQGLIDQSQLAEVLEKADFINREIEDHS